MNKKITSTLLLSTFLSFCASASVPPGSDIQSLQITKSSFDGTIYANDAMQLVTTVLYELGNDEEVQSIKFLKNLTGEPLEQFGWTVDTNDNGFIHTISQANTMSAPFQSSQKAFKTFYLRTNTIGNIDVCVQLSTRSGSTLDTCSGNTNNGFISAKAIEPTQYDATTFSLESKDSSTQDGLYMKFWDIESTMEDLPKTLHIPKLRSASPYSFDSKDALVRQRRPNSNPEWVSLFALDKNVKSVKYSRPTYAPDIGEWDMNIVNNDDTVFRLVQFNYNTKFLGRLWPCHGPIWPSSAKPYPNYVHYECAKYPNIESVKNIDPYITPRTHEYLIVRDQYGNEIVSINAKINTSGNLDLNITND